MSKNCLVTTFKGSVQNDNLPILGKIVLKATGDTTFNSNLPSDTLLEFRGTTYSVSDDRKTIIVNNKYAITLVYTTSIINWTLNFADFKYSHLTEITSRCSYAGTPKDLPATITYLMLRSIAEGGSETFNISDFGHITSLTNIDTSPTTNDFNVVGTIESFVAAAREAGRTTGSVTIGRKTGLSAYSDITYNGTKLTVGKVVSWDASTITVTDIP